MLTYFLGVWYFFNMFLSYYLIFVFNSATRRFVDILHLNETSNKFIMQSSLIFVTIVLILSNWDYYVNSYLIQINCVKFNNVSIACFVHNSRLATLFPHNFEPMILGIYV